MAIKKVPEFICMCWPHDLPRPGRRKRKNPGQDVVKEWDLQKTAKAFDKKKLFPYPGRKLSFRHPI